MDVFQITLFIATFLCSLVAGFLFAFAVVVMPGIKALNDRDFIRAFQVIDGVIQNNQPIFVLVWLGSAIAIIAAVILGIGQLEGLNRALIIAAGLIYIVGVQLPTIIINVPLNNKIQRVNIDAVDEAGHRTAREEFESTWNRWNLRRTVLSVLTTVLLIYCSITIHQYN